MLEDRSILSSRPRPPAARKSISQQPKIEKLDFNLKKNNNNNNNTNTNTNTNTNDNNLSSSPSTLTDSPLSQVAKLLIQNNNQSIDRQIEFKSCGTFLEAWSQQQNQVDHPQEQDQDQMSAIQLEQDQDHHPKSITLEWVSTRTRDELESLLLAADRVIRERERDLGIAASIGKSLLENNIALRARQEKLLVHLSSNSLPSSPNAKRQFEDISNRSEYIEARPPPSPSDYDTSDLPFSLSATFNANTPSKMNNSTLNSHSFQINDRLATSNLPPRFPDCLRSDLSPRSSISSPSSASDNINKNFTPSHLHQRPSSVSPATLNRLTQHNEYLAEQLANLQTETAQSELEGRKRLRKLVKELETLRADLRQTEERNALLEEERLAQLEQQDNNVGNMVDEIVGDMKRVMIQGHEPIIRSYTPTKPIPRDTLDTRNSSSVLDQTPSSNQSVSYSAHDRSHSRVLSVSSKCSSISNLAPSLREIQTSPQERALVSQLLAKISELKETQSEFDRERDEMKIKLRKAREEVEQLRLCVEDAEVELQQVKQLGWEDRRGLIEWEGDDQNIPPTDQRKSSRKATGNRKMIHHSRKTKKRQWPAPEHQAGSIGSDFTIPEPNRSPTFSGFSVDPGSPSMRGQALSMARANSRSGKDTSVDDLPNHLRPVSSFQTLMSDGDESVRSKGGEDLNLNESPIRTLLSEIRGLYPNEDENDKFLHEEIGQEQTQADEENGSAPGISPTSRKSSSSKAVLPSPNPMAHGTYVEWHRAVAETPLEWVDDHVEEDEAPMHKPESKLRKHDSIDWLYSGAHSSSGSHYVESWSATSSATLGLMSGSRPKAKIGSLLRQRQLSCLGYGTGDRRFLGESQSTSSSSTTIGRMTSSDRTTAKSDESRPRGFRRTSRRQEALRRLGIPSSEGTYSYASDSDDVEGESKRVRRCEGEPDEMEETEEDVPAQDSEWNYIDSTDHDHRVQGSTGTDYYPISLRARHTPTMVVNRLQSKGSSWGTFVYQWLKLVSVVGLAVGWAVWQGPRQAIEDEPDDRLAIEHLPSSSSSHSSRKNNSNGSSSASSGSRHGSLKSDA